MKRLVSVATLTALLVFSSVSFAQDEPTAEDIKLAASEFDLGRRAYKDGEYGQAAEHFVAADERAASPAALKAAMQARDKQGKLDRAATLAALIQVRHADKQELVDAAQLIIDRADKELHKVVVNCDAPCTIVINTRLVHGKESTSRILYLDPGSYDVKAGWSKGRTLTESVEAEAGGSSELSFEAPPEPVEEAEEVGPTVAEARPDDTDPVADEEPSGWSPAVFWTGAGVTAALGAVTVWSGIDTVNNPGKAAVREQCATIVEPSDCSPLQDGKKKETRTNILLGLTAGVGALTIVTGAFLTDWSGSPKDEKALNRKARTASRPSVEPFIGVGNGAVVGATGRF